MHQSWLQLRFKVYTTLCRGKTLYNCKSHPRGLLHIEKWYIVSSAEWCRRCILSLMYSDFPVLESYKLDKQHLPWKQLWKCTPPPILRLQSRTGGIHQAPNTTTTSFCWSFNKSSLSIFISVLFLKTIERQISLLIWYSTNTSVCKQLLIYSTSEAFPFWATTPSKSIYELFHAVTEGAVWGI